MEDFSSQMNQRRLTLGRRMRELQAVTGIAQANLSNILAGKRSAQSSTLEAIGDALDARWVLVPKHLLPEVERLLSGKSIGPDETPSTVDRLFGGPAYAEADRGAGERELSGRTKGNEGPAGCGGDT